MMRTASIALVFSALAFASAPVSAASMSCSGDSLAKAEAVIDQMADGPDKWAGYHEIVVAQDDMLNGKARSCVMHIGKVMKMGMMKPAMSGM